MKKHIEKLRREVGQNVRSVVVEILFYRSEQEGDVGNVSINFESGNLFVFGCAGDGGIFVVRPKGSKGNAPDITTVSHNISGLSGTLQEVAADQKTLKLVIGRKVFLLTNVDDELYVTIDGAELSKEYCMR